MDAYEEDERPEEQYLHQGAGTGEYPHGQHQGDEAKDDGKMHARKGKDMGNAADVIRRLQRLADGTPLAKRHRRHNAIDIFIQAGIAVCLEHSLTLPTHVFLHFIDKRQAHRGGAATLDAIGDEHHAQEERGKEQKCR